MNTGHEGSVPESLQIAGIETVCSGNQKITFIAQEAVLLWSWYCFKYLQMTVKPKHLSFLFFFSLDEEQLFLSLLTEEWLERETPIALNS